MSTMGYVSTLEGAAESASLSLDFERQSYRIMEGGKQVSKNLSDLVGFTRPSTAGRFNEKGVYETVEANQQRLDYSPLTKVLRGLLVEEARTNVRTYSAMSNWGVSNSGLKSEPAISLDGRMTGLEVSNTVGVSSYMTRALSAPSGVYTHSVFVKPTGPNFAFVFAEVQGAGNVTFNAITKTFSGGASPSKGFEELGNGWLRVWITTTEQAQTATTLYIGAYGSTNVQSKGIVWGYQIELGTFPTSYIPTIESFNSRSSAATYFDKNGVLKSAGANIPRDSAFVYDQAGEIKPYGLLVEETATNLIRKAGDFMGTAPWASVGVTLSRSLGLDGGLTANRVVEDVVTSVKEIRQTNTISVVTGVAYTYSVYAKATPGADRQLRVGFGNGGIIAGGAQAVFNLKDHTIASVDGGTHLIQKLADGWARYSYTVVATNTATITIYLTLLSGGGAGYQGDGVSGCIMYGPQVEVGRLSTSYIQPAGTFTSRSTTATYIDSNGKLQTAEVNVARDRAYGYEGVSGILRPIDLLLEPSSANLLSYSHDYTAGNWGNFGPGTLPLAVTPNASNGVRGDNTMTLLSRQDLGAKYLSKTFTASTNTIVTRTQRIKAVAGITTPVWVTLRMQTTYANRVDAWFNPVTGECGAQKAGDCALLGVSMTKEADGVWLCSVTGKSGGDAWSSTGLSVLERVGTTDASATAITSVYIDCAQAEIGPVATSYIPTATTSVGRAADVSKAINVTRAADISTSAATTRTADVLSTANLSPWFNLAAGTLSTKVIPGPRVGGTRSVFVFDAGDQTNRIALYDTTSGGNATGRITLNGVESNPSDLANSFVQGVAVKAAAAWSTSAGFTISAGGKNSTTSTVTVVPPVTTLRIGSAHVGGSFNGHIQSTDFYPVRLTNAQLQLLTE